MVSAKVKKRIQHYQKKALWPLFILLILSLLFVYFKGVLPDEKQVKIGVTYMTMNNDFYKTLNAELEKKTNQQGSKLYVGILSWMRASRASRLTFLSEKRLMSLSSIR